MTATATRPAASASAPRSGNPWRPSLRGVALVARIELLRRRPTRKGYIVYGILLAFIVGLAALSAINSDGGRGSLSLELIILMVLATGYLIGPSLAATAINGDSSEGVLAPMQMTRLTAGDLAFGKLLATWGITLLALATTSPFLWFAFTRSGWHGDELAVILGVILLMVLSTTAIALAFSALVARPSISVALTHLVSGFLGIGTFIVFAFSAPLVSQTFVIDVTDRDTSGMTEEQWADQSFDFASLPCVTTEQEVTIQHTDRIAWMMLINPAVVMAEFSPVIDPETAKAEGRAEPGLFAMLHQNVSDMRLGPNTPTDLDWCAFPEDGGSGAMTWEERQLATLTYPPMPWPGFALAVGLGAVAMVLVVHRLRVPYKKLRAGTRVA